MLKSNVLFSFSVHINCIESDSDRICGAEKTIATHYNINPIQKKKKKQESRFDLKKAAGDVGSSSKDVLSSMVFSYSSDKTLRREEQLAI